MINPELYKVNPDLYKEGFEPPVLKLAHIITSPGHKYQVQNRLWQGCPTIERAPGGKLWAGWYSGGPREPDEDNYNLLVYSNDDGLSWSDPVLVIDSIKEEFIRALDIQLWIDPGGRLWVFWTQTRDSSYFNEEGRNKSYCDDIFGVWAITADDADSDDPHWSAPRRLSDGFLRCRPTVLSDGRWLMCAYDWMCDRYAYSVSEDGGRNWLRCSGAVKSGGKCFDETMVTELKDGGIWMLARTNQGYLAQTFSYNGGRTWTPVGFSMFRSPSARFFIRRLESGRLMMINHHGFTGRSHMTALLSEDEGQSWPYMLLLDERSQVSYPDAVEYTDGRIAIVYDRERLGAKEILLAQIKEEDIIAGRIVSPESRLKHIMNKVEADNQ